MIAIARARGRSSGPGEDRRPLTLSVKREDPAPADRNDRSSSAGSAPSGLFEWVALTGLGVSGEVGLAEVVVGGELPVGACPLLLRRPERRSGGGEGGLELSAFSDPFWEGGSSGASASAVVGGVVGVAGRVDGFEMGKAESGEAPVCATLVTAGGGVGTTGPGTMGGALVGACGSPAACEAGEGGAFGGGHTLTLRWRGGAGGSSSCGAVVGGSTGRRRAPSLIATALGFSVLPAPQESLRDGTVSPLLW